MGVDSSTPRQALGASDPEHIGAYRILERIGEGGMATVYKAEQREPVRRIVALKVIKLGMDSKQVVARFEAERQALALMNHPNVAKVFEAGMTDGGRPFFAMEFVPGEPITRFCDDSRLTIRQRIELFIPVCQAVQHAHQKGIIHRDLKPGNILVQLFDGEPVPKVIDFGIAKATNQALTPHTLHTEVGSMLGTPEYMSPEQAQTSGLDVDTRTDVYSLGVILYQLLTGTLPFDPHELRSGGPEGIMRTLRESEPPRPSTRVGGASGESRAVPALEDYRTRLARTHNSDPRQLRRELKGDLDWIVLKAMEKDRARRYATANALAVDLQRCLDEDPVGARPPTTFYRLQKFTRRHRTGVTLTVGVVLALLLALGAITGAFLRASKDRDDAVIARNEAIHQKTIAVQATNNAREKAQEAEAARDRAERVSGFLQEVLTVLSSEPARDVPKYRALDVVADRIDRSALAGDPAAEARVRTLLGRRYSALGLYGRAASQFGAALQRNRELHSGNAPPVLLEDLNELADALVTDGNPSAAEPLLREALGSQRQTGDTSSAAFARTLDLLGSIDAARNNWTDAREHYRQAMEVRQRLSVVGRDWADSLAHRGDVLLHDNDSRGRRDIADALRMYHEAYAAQPPALAGPLRRLARSAGARGEWPVAHDLLHEASLSGCNDLQLFRELIQVQSVLLGSNPADAALLAERAWFHARLGEFDAAVTDYSAAIKFDPRRDVNWHEALPLILYRHDVDGYLRARHDALQRFSASPKAEVLHRIAKSCLCYPLQGPELDLATSMAIQALRANPDQLFYVQSMGMAEYRAGHFDAAISYFARCRDNSFRVRDITADFYTSMAFFERGDKQQAVRAFEQGTQLWSSQAPKPGIDDFVGFQDWMICDLARHEAAKFLNRDVQATESSSPAESRCRRDCHSCERHPSPPRRWAAVAEVYSDYGKPSGRTPRCVPVLGSLWRELPGKWQRSQADTDLPAPVPHHRGKFDI